MKEKNDKIKVIYEQVLNEIITNLNNQDPIVRSQAFQTLSTPSVFDAMVGLNKIVSHEILFQQLKTETSSEVIIAAEYLLKKILELELK